MPGKKPLPPSYFMGFIVLIVLAHFLVPLVRIINFPWNLSGILPIILGTWLNLSADRAFKDARTTVKPFEESTLLITGGVFRVSRNPMYLGMVLILCGGAIISGTLAPFFIVGIFALVMDIRFIRTEEQMLEASFGEKWPAYKANVRRWI